MKRCKCCGWWFEPKTGRSMYCDEECRREGLLASKRRYYQSVKQKKRQTALKCDPKKLPVPMLPPTKRVMGKDWELQKSFESMERRRQFEAL